MLLWHREAGVRAPPEREMRRSRGLGHAAEAGPAGVKAEASRLPRNQQADPLDEGGDGEARGAGTGGGQLSGATP